MKNYLQDITLTLTTLCAINDGLKLAGLTWSPVLVADPWSEPDGLNLVGKLSCDPVLLDGEGLYAWVPGTRECETIAYCNRPVLYVGRGLRWVQRTDDETKWISSSAAHFHGKVMHQYDGIVCGNIVGFNKPKNRLDPALKLLNTHLKDLSDKDGSCPIAKVREWFCDPDRSALDIAEPLAIRLAGHVGYMAPPVNSQYAGAWDVWTPAEWMAFAIAEEMKSP